MMKKKIAAAALSLLACMSLGAQENAADIKAEYERQVRYVGLAGVGVETIINRWEAAAPEDPEVYVARFNYWLSKSAAESVVITRPQKRYLGNDPVMTLKDSLGRDVYYFEDVNYDDEAFGEALKAIDRAIELNPQEISYRFGKITSIMDYEKESPDMTAAEIFSLIDDYQAGGEGWTYAGETLTQELFCQGISEYCYRFFRTASPASYEYFLEISEKMNKLYPDEVVFIDNIGSYWQVNGDSRKALRYYRKALKIDPEDYAANNNIRLIQSSQSRKGRPSK